MTIRQLSYGSLKVDVDFKSAAVGSFSKGRPNRANRLIVLHSAECSEVTTAAENLASWSAGKQHPQASWHFAVDNNSITQSVELNDVAWHAGCINGYSLGVEQAGRASQTAEQWADPYSAAVLENTARLLAVLAGTYDIPLRHVASDLATVRGVCTHADVSKWFKVKGGHTDPGVNYPIESVLIRAKCLQFEAMQ